MPPKIKFSRTGLKDSALRLGATLVLMVLVTGCVSTQAPSEWEPLKASVEALYLNYRDLETLHSDLHTAAQIHLENSGSQLAEIQSAARFIQQANLIAYYQWELLSITHYIRTTALRDFYTLRERDLHDARDKSKDLILATRVYEAFIQDPKALELIAACIQRIEKHMGLYAQMAAELRQLKGGAATVASPQGGAL